MASFNLMNWLRTKKQIVLWLVMGGFLVSMFVGFGLYVQTGRSSADAVLEVNGKKISYRSYMALYNRAINEVRDQKRELTPEISQQIKQQVMQQLTQSQVMANEAQRYGITVSDEQLSAFLASVPAFQKDGKFDPQTYLQALQFGVHMAPKDFEENQKKEIAALQLRQIIQDGIKISDKELELNASLHLAMMPADKKNEELKKIQENPEAFRQQLREQKVNQTLEQWVRQLNTNLQVKSYLDRIEKMSPAR